MEITFGRRPKLLGHPAIKETPRTDRRDHGPSRAAKIQDASSVSRLPRGYTSVPNEPKRIPVAKKPSPRRRQPGTSRQTNEVTPTSKPHSLPIQFATEAVRRRLCAHQGRNSQTNKLSNLVRARLHRLSQAHVMPTHPSGGESAWHIPSSRCQRAKPLGKTTSCAKMRSRRAASRATSSSSHRNSTLFLPRMHATTANVILYALRHILTLSATRLETTHRQATESK